MKPPLHTKPLKKRTLLGRWAAYLLFNTNRAFSGIVNGLHYAGGATRSMLNFVAPLFFIYTAFTVLFPALKNWEYLSKGRRRLVLLGCLASLFTAIMLFVAMTTPAWWLADVHLWTFLNQTAISGTMFFSGVKVSTLLLAIEPACFLQKIFVNIIPGGPMWSASTDVASGKFWSIGKPLKLKVPRIGNMWVKLVIAILCVTVFSFKACRDVKDYNTKPPKSRWEQRPVV